MSRQTQTGRQADRQTDRERVSVLLYVHGDRTDYSGRGAARMSTSFRQLLSSERQTDRQRWREGGRGERETDKRTDTAKERHTDRQRQKQRETEVETAETEKGERERERESRRVHQIVCPTRKKEKTIR